MRVTIDARLDYRFPREADVLLALRARPSQDQYIEDEDLTVTGQSRLMGVRNAIANDRRSWMVAEGDVSIRYRANIEVNRPPLALQGRSVPPRPRLPADVIDYLMPSHYSAGEAMENFAWSQFSHLHGGDQVLAMIDWIRGSFIYAPGSSNAKTTAADTFAARQGVCRDYAHVLISFCRAVGIPARMVSAYAPGLNPPDFHAIVDVWLDGQWHLVDPTGMAPTEKLVRIICGRDAADISFMTIFGEAELLFQSVSAVDATANTYAA